MNRRFRPRPPRLDSQSSKTSTGEAGSHNPGKRPRGRADPDTAEQANACCPDRSRHRRWPFWPPLRVRTFRHLQNPRSETRHISGSFTGGLFTCCTMFPGAARRRIRRHSGRRAGSAHACLAGFFNYSIDNCIYCTYSVYIQYIQYIQLFGSGWLPD